MKILCLKMPPLPFVAVVSLLVGSAVLPAGGAEKPEAFWPQWRGPLATGAAPLADPPLTWSESNNLKWKAPIPGFGTSTPIVWGDSVFIVSARPKDGQSAPAGGRRGAPKVNHEFVVLNYDRATGKVRWEKVVREVVPHEGAHADHGFASGSPVTDGEHLYAWFGSRGLHCLDFDGNVKWSKDFGQMQTRNSFGEGTSPALHGNTLVVFWDDETDNDFIVGLDKKSGKELWRTPRDEATGWSTPLIVEHNGRAQVVVNASGKVRSYELESGKEIWSCAGQTANAIPTPVADAKNVYVTSGFRGSALLAIALGQTGDLTGTDAVRWSRSKNTPYVSSPLLTDDLLYLVTGNNGVLSCINAKDGQAQFEGERLEGITGIYASPVSAKDRVYVLGRNGLCLVLKKGPTLEILARNKVDDRTDASIALVDRDLFIRGHQFLYCFTH